MFVHTGPFAQHRPRQLVDLADLIGLKLADYVVTESGFGADMGIEKFINIKCRDSGLRAGRGRDRRHGARAQDAQRPVPHRGRPPARPRAGPRGPRGGRGRLRNLEKQIENARTFGVPVVVAINRFRTDTDAEIELIRRRVARRGRRGRRGQRGLGQGRRRRRGAGARRARGGRAAQAPSASSTSSTGRSARRSRPSRPACTAPTASTTCPRPTRRSRSTPSSGFGDLPICMAKTHLSLSHDADAQGPPERLPRADPRGARRRGRGLPLPALGEMRTMPGLPSEPNTWKIDLDDDGNVVGLF